jgi:hypothetical protein
LKHLISFHIDANLAGGEFFVFIQCEQFRTCIFLALGESSINGKVNIGDKYENGDIYLEEISV